MLDAVRAGAKKLYLQFWYYYEVLRTECSMLYYGELSTHVVRSKSSEVTGYSS